MTDGDAILAAILANPDDDTPRLVYADWLDDQGDAGLSMRADFIRASIGVARVPPCTQRQCSGAVPCGDCSDRQRLDSRAAALWTGSLREPTLTAVGLDPNGSAYVTMTRGFIDQLGGVSAADWLANGDAIVKAHPVRRVTLTTMPDTVAWAASCPYPEFNWNLRSGAGATVKIPRWPSITFELPPAEPENAADWVIDIRRSPLDNGRDFIRREVVEGVLEASMPAAIAPQPGDMIGPIIARGRTGGRYRVPQALVVRVNYEENFRGPFVAVVEARTSGEFTCVAD